MAEDDGPDGSREKADGVDPECFERADEGIGAREEEVREYESGDGAVEEEVVPFDGGADGPG